MQPLSFGALLKRYRVAAGLTQEALAERAGLSARAISDLEREISRTPHPDTVQRIAGALHLVVADRAALAAAARRDAAAPLPRGRSPTSRPASTPALAGRARELALLDRHLAGESPPLLLLTGEPGIGKTRLLREAVTSAGGYGLRALSGSCQRRSAQMPYSPILEALKGYIQDQTPAQLRTDLRGCAWLVRLLPELADGPIEPLPPWTVTPEQEKRLMFEAMARFIANVAGPAGTLLVLDDLQWAGSDALDRLATLVTRGAVAPQTPDDPPPLRIVGAYRATEVGPGHALTTLLDDLAHAGLALRHVLAPLTRQESEQLLDTLLDGVADDPEAPRERTLQRASGVPSMLLRYARDARMGLDAPEPAVMPLPPPTIPQQGPLAARPRFTLPVPLTAVVDREHEVAAVTDLLRRDEIRLLTLTGPGGVGKTRLALHLAGGLAERGADGAVFVNLAPIRDPKLVELTIARALGLEDAGSRPVRERLTEYLRERQMLLLLDNFEQVLEAAPPVAELLQVCPRLTALVTSRAALHVRGEHQYPVQPLAVPDLRQPWSTEALARYPAVALFVQRAQAVKPDWDIPGSHGPVVAQICRCLDGLPLAIELAAARIKSLPPEDMLRRLEHRLPMLTGGPRDLPERQKTMRDTIAWSYYLLDAAEQALFRRLSIFVGGCTLEAAEAIAGAERWGRESEQSGATSDALHSAATLLQGLESLEDMSLVHVVRQTDAEARFGMLETIREYGLERLDAAGELATAHERHAAYYLALVESAEPNLTGPQQATWLDRLEREHDNLRTALRRVAETGEVHLGLRMAGALWHFWWTHGHLSEKRTWLGGLLSRNHTDEVAGGDHRAARAKALHGAGVLASYQGDFGHGATLLDESLALYRELGDSVGLAGALVGLGNASQWLEDYGRAAVLFEEGLALYRDLGDRQGIANALTNLGTLLMLRGEYAQAATLYEESLAQHRG